jgi:AraC-like DNA-binding protein
MNKSDREIFLPLFLLQLPQKTLARYDVTQADWIELLGTMLDIDVSRSKLNESLISLADFCAVLRLALDRFGPENFQQAYIEDIRARHMGPVGLAMEAAPTIEDSLAIWRDNAAFLAPIIRITSREADGRRLYEIVLTEDLGDIAEIYMELALVLSASIILHLTGGTVRAAIEFAHAPRNAAEFYTGLYGEEPRFNAGRYSLGFSLCEITRANDYYVPLIYQQAMQGIAQLRQTMEEHHRLSFRLRKLLQQGADEGRLPTLEEAARHFNMSARTFARHLADEGHSFREMRTDAWMGLAKRLLRQPRLAIKNIATRAGFDNVSAFSRAFAGSCGQSPQEFRNMLDSAAGPAEDAAESGR